MTGLNESRLSYGGNFDNRRGASLPITPENYQSEEERIKSFVGWPLNEAVHPEQLARVGLVSIKPGIFPLIFNMISDLSINFIVFSWMLKARIEWQVPVPDKWRCIMIFNFFRCRSKTTSGTCGDGLKCSGR